MSEIKEFIVEFLGNTVDVNKLEYVSRCLPHDSTMSYESSDFVYFEFVINGNSFITRADYKDKVEHAHKYLTQVWKNYSKNGYK